MKTRATVLAAFSFLFGAACAHVGGEKPVELSLKPYAGRLVTLDVEAGGKSYAMLFDTGAGVTALTPETAAAVGCAPFGRLVGWRMTGVRVEFQRCGAMDLSFAGILSRKETYVFDLGAVLPKDLPPLGGIVSLASFADRPFTLDLNAKKLIIETKESLRRRIKDARRAEMRLIRGPGGDDAAVLVEVAGEPGGFWFLLDSANLGDVLVSPDAAGSSEFALGGRLSADEATAIVIPLAGVGPVDASARLRDIIYDGALNEETMRRFRITFDLISDRIWLAPN